MEEHHTRRAVRTHVLLVLAPLLLSLVALSGCATPVSNRGPGDETEPEPAQTEAPLVLVIGDSYTEGAGLTSPHRSWAWLACGDLHWSAVIDGVGGTGFTRGGEVGRYANRINAWRATGMSFDAVILQGGLNDWRLTPADVSAGVESAVGAARAAWPAAEIIVFGPVAPTSQQSTGLGVEFAIASAAGRAGAWYIDPARPDAWIDDSNSDVFDRGDGLHLNADGHRFIADRFVAAVEGAIAERVRS